MIITKPCESCEHNKVCGVKEDVLMAVDTIKEDVREKSSLISISVSCSEYREQPTRRRL